MGFPSRYFAGYNTTDWLFLLGREPLDGGCQGQAQQKQAGRGAYTQARSSTMESKNGSGREENQTTAVPSRGKILQFARKMRASNFGGRLSC
jgi:hypothetical protein